MTSSSLEDLIKYRDTIFQTINNLEMGLLTEKKKLNEFEFYAKDPDYDPQAMQDQIQRSKENIKNIQNVLKAEKDKLTDIENQITSSQNIIHAHGTFPCLIGTIPHNWQVLEQFPSGQFKRRKCQMCNSEERLGYNWASKLNLA